MVGKIELAACIYQCGDPKLPLFSCSSPAARSVSWVQVVNKKMHHLHLFYMMCEG